MQGFYYRVMRLAQKYEDPRLRHNILTVEELSPFLDLIMTMAATIDSQQEKITKMENGLKEKTGGAAGEGEI